MRKHRENKLRDNLGLKTHAGLVTCEASKNPDAISETAGAEKSERPNHISNSADARETGSDFGLSRYNEEAGARGI